MIDGFDSMLTLFSQASALRAARNSPAANVKTLKPDRDRAAEGDQRLRPGGEGSRPGGVELTSKRPDADRPLDAELVSSVSVTSAASTSISTWRGIRSSFLIVPSISVQSRG